MMGTLHDYQKILEEPEVLMPSVKLSHLNESDRRK